jgi:hypothetical protein
MMNLSGILVELFALGRRFSRSISVYIAKHFLMSIFIRQDFTFFLFTLVVVSSNTLRVGRGSLLCESQAQYFHLVRLRLLSNMSRLIKWMLGASRSSRISNLTPWSCSHVGLSLSSQAINVPWAITSYCYLPLIGRFHYPPRPQEELNIVLISTFRGE